ncbi:MAG: TIGR03905 family TSCPD domain-containing protein [Firmicutes bacterium]|nr:TIGR03905 family TSCPD domain-containing protein [Bacillota bacterium]
MHYDFKPSGVCSVNISFDIEDGRLHNVKYTGGCDGNLKAIGKLVEGRSAAEVAQLLKGNTCGWKPTSCGDQLSKAIEGALNTANA